MGLGVPREALLSQDSPESPLCLRTLLDRISDTGGAGGELRVAKENTRVGTTTFTVPFTVLAFV